MVDALVRGSWPAASPAWPAPTTTTSIRSVIRRRFYGRRGALSACRALAADDLPGSAELLVQLAAIDVLNAGYLDHPGILGRLGQPLDVGGERGQNYSSLVDLGHLQGVGEPQRAWNPARQSRFRRIRSPRESASTYWTLQASRRRAGTPRPRFEHKVRAWRTEVIHCRDDSRRPPPCCTRRVRRSHWLGLRARRGHP